MGKKLKMAPGLEWPKNGRRNGKNGEKSHFGVHFSTSMAIFRPFQAGGHFRLISHYPRIFVPDRFPILCRWPPQTQDYTAVAAFSLRLRLRLTFECPNPEKSPASNPCLFRFPCFFIALATKGFSRDQHRGLKNTTLPRKIALTKARSSRIFYFPFTKIQSNERVTKR